MPSGRLFGDCTESLYRTKWLWIITQVVLKSIKVLYWAVDAKATVCYVLDVISAHFLIGGTIEDA